MSLQSTKKQRKYKPAYCDKCNKQLTWFTYHSVWNGGEYVRYCTDCYYRKETQ